MKTEHVGTTSSTLDRCLNRLRGFGFSATIVDELPDGGAIVHIEGRRSTTDMRLTRHDDLTLTGLLREGVELDDHTSIRIGETVSARAAHALRSRRVNFLDTAGNAFLDTDDWYVDVRGQRHDSGGDEPPVPRSPRNAFSTKRAQVVFAILQWEGLEDADLRTVAYVAGTSVGLAHRTLAELRAEPDLWPSTREARDNLLTAWLAAYPTGLGAAHYLGRYRADDVRAVQGEASISGDPAVAHLLRPTEVIVYVDELTPELVARNRWAQDPQGNVTVKRRFWRDPDAAEVAGPTGSAAAPHLLVLADLASSNDPRRREAATVSRASRSL